MKCPSIHHKSSPKPLVFLADVEDDVSRSDGGFNRSDVEDDVEEIRWWSTDPMLKMMFQMTVRY
ncbi:hypothetical protein HanRHA438_Chr11g0514291 [Helianthus annuus]|nr:hypothetical protein HanIR_Chr11g0540081 [Helianthus annuus]KAJ0871594.1 hypothetical protein HanRHA438_Chr11g0514291 [Helianthus annuus]